MLRSIEFKIKDYVNNFDQIFLIEADEIETKYFADLDKGVCVLRRISFQKLRILICDMRLDSL